MGKGGIRRVRAKSLERNELHGGKIFAPEEAAAAESPRFLHRGGARRPERNSRARLGLEGSGGHRDGRSVGEQPGGGAAGSGPASRLRPHGGAAGRLRGALPAGAARADGEWEAWRGRRSDLQRRLREYLPERIEKQSRNRFSPEDSSARPLSGWRMRRAASRIWRPSSERGGMGRPSARASWTPA